MTSNNEILAVLERVSQKLHLVLEHYVWLRHYFQEMESSPLWNEVLETLAFPEHPLLQQQQKELAGKINYIVPKRLQRGSQGGLFYINAENKKIYLNQHMKKKWKQGRLSGCIGSLCNSVPQMDF